MSLVLRSKSFEQGAVIPREHTGEGADSSPPLTWSGAPSQTQAFALICDDPDAPGAVWDHWVLYDLPRDVTELKSGFPRDEQLADGTKQGINSWHKTGYGGPMPPQGHGPHRYYFRLYALSAPTELPVGATKAALLQAIEDTTLAQAELMGTYERRA